MSQAQQVVRLYCCWDVFTMNVDSNTHQHVLRALHNVPVQLHQVTLRQSLEAKVLVVQVAAVHQCTIQLFSVSHGDFEQLIRH